LALDRKNVSNEYYKDAYPYFLRSQGPFKVYDHAKAKGQSFVENLQAIHDQAHLRFEQECKQIQKLRTFEREEFNWQKKKQDIIAMHNQKMKRQNNLNNLKQLAVQIEEDREKKKVQTFIDKQFYKTHFGPEETDDLITKKLRQEEAKKQELVVGLERQIQLNKQLKESKRKEERNHDLNNLEIAHSTFMAEQRAIQAKLMKEK
jgi:hypothetical protein